MERTLNFNINSDKVRSGLNVINSGLKKTQRIGMDTAKMIGRAFKTAAKTMIVGAGLVGAAMVAMAAKSLAAGDDLAKTADKIGITTEALSILNNQAELFTNGGAKAMAEALTKASKRLGEFNANGGGAAGVWLKKLNLDTQELGRLSPDQLFNRYAESIRGLNSRGEQLAAISALMGDESRKLIGIVDASSESLNQAAQDAQLFGIVLSRVDAAKFEMVNDSVTRAKSLFTGFSNQMTIAMAPALNAVLSLFVDTAKEAGGMGNVSTKVADAMIGAFGFVADAVNGLYVVFKGLQTIFAFVATNILKGIRAIAQGFIYINNLNPLADKMEDFTALDSIIIQSTANLDEYAASLNTAVMAPPPSVAIGDVVAQEQAKMRAEAESIAANAPSAIAPEEDPTIVAQAQTDAIKIQMAADTESTITGIVAKEQYSRQQLTQMTLSSTSSALGSLSQLLSSAGKKQSTAAKVFAKASIITSTAVAIMKAWELPWPANIAAAAAAGAQGILQLRNAGAAGGSSGIGRGSTTLPVSSAPGLAATPIATPTQIQPTRGETVIQLQGNFYGWDDAVIDDLITGIASAVDDRDVRVISPDSRNGQDLLGAV